MDDHKAGFFTEDNSVDVVVARNKNTKDPRIKEVMEVIVRKLHEAIKEIEPSEDEWLEAIMFLTQTGQICDDYQARIHPFVRYPWRVDVV